MNGQPERKQNLTVDPKLCKVYANAERKCNRVTRIDELGKLAVTSNRSTLRRNLNTTIIASQPASVYSYC
jgi:hypothetical protein